MNPNRHRWLASAIGIALFLLCSALLETNQDEVAEQATAQSVTALGEEAAGQLSDADIERLAKQARLSFPLQPFKQLQADAAVRKERK